MKLFNIFFYIICTSKLKIQYKFRESSVFFFSKLLSSIFENGGKFCKIILFLTKILIKLKIVRILEHEK